jgi:hypothetical protein
MPQTMLIMNMIKMSEIGNMNLNRNKVIREMLFTFLQDAFLTVAGCPSRYYDGLKLVVGKPSDPEELRAGYDMELRGITISSRVQPLNRENVDYNYANNTRYNDSPMSRIERVNGYMEIARDRSRAFYPKAQIVPTTHAIVNGKDAVRTMNACHARNYSQMCVYEAVDNTPAIRLGGWLIAYVPHSFENIKYSDLGRLHVV